MARKKANGHGTRTKEIVTCKVNSKKVNNTVIGHTGSQQEKFLTQRTTRKVLKSGQWTYLYKERRKIQRRYVRQRHEERYLEGLGMKMEPCLWRENT